MKRAKITEYSVFDVDEAKQENAQIITTPRS
jgi:hypothetical protein